MNEPINLDDYHEYWILDHTSRAYDLKEEIKSWAGFWVPEHKSWCIHTSRDDSAFRTLTKLGLKLQYRENEK